MAGALDLRLNTTELRITGGPTFSTFSMNGTTTQVAGIIQMPYSDTITALGTLYGTRTGTPPTYLISLQSLTTGLPSGTILGAGSPASATFTPPADTTWNNTWRWITLANSIAVTAGTWYAVCITYSSGTVSGANFSSFNQDAGNFGNWRLGSDYVANGTGSWARSTAGPPMFGLQSSTLSYGFPFTGQAARTISSSGNRGTMKITIPSTYWSTCSVRGFWMVVNAPTTGGTWKPGIWNAAGTAIQADSYSTNNITNSGSGSCGFEFNFTTPAVLTAGTTYYVGIEHSGTDFGPNVLTLPTAGDQTAYPLRANCNYSLWGGSSWTDTLTDRPVGALILSDITAPSSGGPIGNNIQGGFVNG